MTRNTASGRRAAARPSRSSSSTSTSKATSTTRKPERVHAWKGGATVTFCGKPAAPRLCVTSSQFELVTCPDCLAAIEPNTTSSTSKATSTTRKPARVHAYQTGDVTECGMPTTRRRMTLISAQATCPGCLDAIAARTQQELEAASKAPPHVTQPEPMETPAAPLSEALVTTGPTCATNAADSAAALPEPTAEAVPAHVPATLRYTCSRCSWSTVDRAEAATHATRSHRMRTEAVLPETLGAAHAGAWLLEPTLRQLEQMQLAVSEPEAMRRERLRAAEAECAVLGHVPAGGMVRGGCCRFCGAELGPVDMAAAEQELYAAITCLPSRPEVVEALEADRGDEVAEALAGVRAALEAMTEGASPELRKALQRCIPSHEWVLAAIKDRDESRLNTCLDQVRQQLAHWNARLRERVAPVAATHGTASTPRQRPARQPSPTPTVPALTLPAVVSLVAASAAALTTSAAKLLERVEAERPDLSLIRGQLQTLQCELESVAPRLRTVQQLLLSADDLATQADSQTAGVR